MVGREESKDYKVCTTVNIPPLAWKLFLVSQGFYVHTKLGRDFPN